MLRTGQQGWGVAGGTVVLRTGQQGVRVGGCMVVGGCV